MKLIKKKLKKFEILQYKLVNSYTFDMREYAHKPV